MYLFSLPVFIPLQHFISFISLFKESALGFVYPFCCSEICCFNFFETVLLIWLNPFLFNIVLYYLLSPTLFGLPGYSVPTFVSCMFNSLTLGLSFLSVELFKMIDFPLISISAVLPQFNTQCLLLLRFSFFSLTHILFRKVFSLQT